MPQRCSIRTYSMPLALLKTIHSGSTGSYRSCVRSIIELAKLSIVRRPRARSVHDRRNDINCMHAHHSCGHPESVQNRSQGLALHTAQRMVEDSGYVRYKVAAIYRLSKNVLSTHETRRLIMRTMSRDHDRLCLECLFTLQHRLL